MNKSEADAKLAELINSPTEWFCPQINDSCYCYMPAAVILCCELLSKYRVRPAYCCHVLHQEKIKIPGKRKE